MFTHAELSVKALTSCSTDEERQLLLERFKSTKKRSQQLRRGGAASNSRDSRSRNHLPPSARKLLRRLDEMMEGRDAEVRTPEVHKTS
mmetsp:Transcript_31045/g.56463  ORF Transcript_31045/g.56463 Transcript_31045/m.56463 type:complete len:88 (+) Transcript_31045:37-300(+)